VPIREVFFGNSKSDYVDDMLSEGALKKMGLFNDKKVARLLMKYRNGGQGSEVQNMAVVGILSTQLVHHQFIENFPWKPLESLEPDKVIRNF
jgi:asparagine synthase (glutamine-hydrolysing)